MRTRERAIHSLDGAPIRGRLESVRLYESTVERGGRESHLGAPEIDSEHEVAAGGVCIEHFR